MLTNNNGSHIIKLNKAELFSLDRLLANIRKKDVFINRNVKHLRVISWCSFAVSVILFISGVYYLLFLLIAVAAAFFGLILRVVKNVIEQAVAIKNENDFYHLEGRVRNGHIG